MPKEKCIPKFFNFLTPKVGGFVLECGYIDDKAKILNNISLEKSSTLL